MEVALGRIKQGRGIEAVRSEGIRERQVRVEPRKSPPETEETARGGGSSRMRDTEEEQGRERASLPFGRTPYPMQSEEELGHMSRIKLGARPRPESSPIGCSATSLVRAPMGRDP